MDNGSIWLPEATSTTAAEVDGLFYFILYSSAVLLAIVAGLMIYFGIRYRRRGEDTLTTSVDHNNILEIIWTVIPTIVIMIIFVWGFKGFIALHVIPHDAMEVKVTAQRWSWTFDYPEGVNVATNLVVPVNTPVKLLMSSTDVIHSFFVPNFRIKMDVLPNRYTLAWFEATKIGEYNIFCTEYCGKGHSEMLGTVSVLSDSDYVVWLDEASDPGKGLTPVEYGKKLYTMRACNTCHSIDGSIVEGPSLFGRFGTQIELRDGSKVLMDENYIRESVLNPKAKVVKGFQPVMPPFQGVLKDDQIDALIAYIKSLNR